MSMTVTNQDNGALIIAHHRTRPETFRAGGAATYAVGTLLARNTTDNKLHPFANGGANGTGTPIALLLEEVVATGAADFPIDALIYGRVRKDKLVINGQSDLAQLTVARIDALAALGIEIVDVTENSSGA